MRTIAMAQRVDVDMFLDAAAFGNGFEGFLYATSIHRYRRAGARSSIFTGRKDQSWMAMRGPVAP
jgi:hypothetical protein